MFYCRLLISGHKKVKKQKARSDVEMRKARLATIRGAQLPGLHLLHTHKKKTERKHENTKQNEKKTQHLVIERTEGKSKWVC